MSEAVYRQTFEDKYCPPGLSREDALTRIARSLSENAEEEKRFNDILQDFKFLPAGRVLSAYAAQRNTTPYNCFVSESIEDSMSGIMRAVGRAAEVLRRGGGIGYDFSSIRYKGAPIKSFDTEASGPLSFMPVFEAMARTVTSAGERRGAQMAVLRVDHPDIEEFIKVKCVEDERNPFRMFNLSVGVTDEFMDAVRRDLPFNLTWQGRVIRTVRAKSLWSLIMDCTWEWSDPGVLFIDRINRLNNLHYCETIAATNPCGEQPLPPNGACLLGSVNLTRFVQDGYFDFVELRRVVHSATRMLNRVIDTALYPFPEHKDEMLSKRRIGIGVMGLANAGEAIAGAYGSKPFLEFSRSVFETICHAAYGESARMAKEQGPFPLYHKELYGNGAFIRTLPKYLRSAIGEYGIRNSHLTSIAPTGTLSLVAGNVSSGIEPTFAKRYERRILLKGDVLPRTVELVDYGVEHLNVKPWTAEELLPTEHLEVVGVAQKFVDSGISKTCNIHDKVIREEFEKTYHLAWDLGLKGCTTFRPSGKRMGILKASSDTVGPACYIDEHGQRQCSE